MASVTVVHDTIEEFNVDSSWVWRQILREKVRTWVRVAAIVLEADEAAQENEEEQQEKHEHNEDPPETLNRLT